MFKIIFPGLFANQNPVNLIRFSGQWRHAVQGIYRQISIK